MLNLYYPGGRITLRVVNQVPVIFLKAFNKKVKRLGKVYRIITFKKALKYKFLRNCLMRVLSQKKSSRNLQTQMKIQIIQIMTSKMRKVFVDFLSRNVSFSYRISVLKITKMRKT